MAPNNHLYNGLVWALTPAAKTEIDGLVSSGLDFDLAFALVDDQVLSGMRPESDVYTLHAPEEVSPTNETQRIVR